MKRQYPRIEVTQRTYDLLRIEEVRSHTTIKDIVEKLVEDNISAEAKTALGDNVSKTGRPKKPRDRMQPPMEPAPPADRPFSSKNPEHVAVTRAV